MSLLYDPSPRVEGPSASSVLFTWIVWLPIGAACLYVAWGYAAAGGGGDAVSLGIELALGLVGVAAIGRAAVRTRHWLRREGGGAP